mgnify:CR=1 FL=1
MMGVDFQVFTGQYISKPGAAYASFVVSGKTDENPAKPLNDGRTAKVFRGYRLGEKSNYTKFIEFATNEDTNGHPIIVRKRKRKRNSFS